MMDPPISSPAMSKRDDTARLIYSRAEELAQSGEFGGWTEIQRVLVREGHAEAARHLYSKAKRHWLDMLCARHQKPTQDKH
jgi:hypothetical protein